jgi:hypothetical protein
VGFTIQKPAHRAYKPKGKAYASESKRLECLHKMKKRKFFPRFLENEASLYD